MIHSDGRFKMVCLSPEALLGLFWDVNQWPDQVCKVEAPELPADARIDEMGYDNYRRQWYVRVHSSTFPVVPAGEYIPQLLSANVQFSCRPLDEMAASIPVADYQALKRQLEMVTGVADAAASRCKKAVSALRDLHRATINDPIHARLRAQIDAVLSPEESGEGL